MKIFLILLVIAAAICRVVGRCMQGMGGYIVGKRTDSHDYDEPETDVYKKALKLRSVSNCLLPAFSVISINTLIKYIN